MGAGLFHADRRPGHKEAKSRLFAILRARIIRMEDHTHVRQTQGESTVTVYTVVSWLDSR